MKKTIYTLSILIIFPFSLRSQADLEVEREGTLEKTLTIATNTFSENNEILIGDFVNDGSSILKFDSGFQSAIIGIDKDLQGITGTTSPHSLIFQTSPVSGLKINLNGRVGLGTMNPGAAFHVSRDGIANNPINLAILNSSTSNKPALLFSEGGLGAGKTMGILYNGSGSGASEKLQIINDAADPIVTWTNNELMGIGTENPREEVDVNGNVAISSVPGSLTISNGTSNANLTFDGTNLDLTSITGSSKIKADRRVILQSLGGTVILDANDGIFFQVDGDTKLNCLQNGNWGLNQINPQARLHIKQNTSALPAIRIENDSDTDSWDWEVDITVLTLSFNNTAKGFYNTNGTYTLFSDRRLKNEITAMNDGVLASVLKLKPCNYYFKNDINSEHKTIGFIAQEMQEQFPKLVSENDTEESNILGIKYSQISVYAVKAIQEQYQEIKELKEATDLDQINESEIIKLDNELADIQKRISGLK